MRVLTVQQPWAWAIFHGKDVENRSQLWSYRGELAIHAGKRLDAAALGMDLIEDAWTDAFGWGPARDGLFLRGVILGVVDLVEVHVANEGCCESPWAEQSYVEFGGGAHHNITHLVLENPRSLAFMNPLIAATGMLGLWRPDEFLEDRIRDGLALREQIGSQR